MVSVLLVLCLHGLALGADPPPSVDAVLDRVAEVHADGLDVGTLRTVALEGVTSWLEQRDPSGAVRILSSGEVERARAEARGERFGVGLEVLLARGYGARVLEVFPGTPAEEAGIDVGDVVVGVDDVDVQGLDPAAVRRLLDPRAGRALKLQVVAVDGTLLEVSLEPRTYTTPAVTVTRGSDYRILRIHHFGRGAARSLQASLGQVADREALVLDLRDTRDGRPEEAAAAAAPFLSGDEPVAAVRIGPGQVRDTLQVPPATRWTRRLVILVNGGTEGVAELFAAAVQRTDAGAVFVGMPTAGVDVVPDWVRIDRTRWVQVPAARLVLPDGSTWSHVGVVPDVRVQAFSGPVLLPPPAPPPDLQVDAALRVVRSP
ncbi:MAG: PDZ domain-containing protein [Deltaproteobacteria bacterium]|nr:PDZ domain-containing protein [Deltaproteobacteria bacterium]